MRRNIYDILSDRKIDISVEYNRIYDLFYCKGIANGWGKPITIENVVSAKFCELNKKLIGRCLSLEDFNNTYKFFFKKQKEDVDIDLLISFSEYVFNFVFAVLPCAPTILGDISELHSILLHISDCMDEIGYKITEKESFFIIVEKNAAAIAVAEVSDKGLAGDILEYNHHKLKGNLSEKKNILKNMADDIEPQRNRLKQINASFTSDLFQLMNRFIRHNSVGNSYISSISKSELENIYDEIYQMWLLAKMQLEYSEKANYIAGIIKKLN